MLTPFDEEAFKPSEGEGTATITGQAFLKTRGGDVKFGAGCEVVLSPVTPYTTELRQRVTIGGEKLAPTDPRLNDYLRRTIADGFGNFEFANLPAGDYYLMSWITWEVPSGSIMTTSGGAAYATVTVRDGETVKAIVTR